MNRYKKSEYRIHNLRDEAKFEKMENLQVFIKTKFKVFADHNDLCIGYVEPGHGWKGKYLWLNNDEDIKELYSVCGMLKNILLWCYLPNHDNKKKRKLESSKESMEPKNKRDKCLSSNTSKADEAKDIHQVLLDKHEKKYTPEQLHAWAEMVQMKKHTSLEDPPAYPFFKVKGTKKRPSEEKKKRGVHNSCCTCFVSFTVHSYTNRVH